MKINIKLGRELEWLISKVETITGETYHDIDTMEIDELRYALFDLLQKYEELEKRCDNVNKCSLCGNSFIGVGHNPEPLKDYTERCCDECNTTKVIPARLNRMKEIVKK